MNSSKILVLHLVLLILLFTIGTSWQAAAQSCNQGAIWTASENGWTGIWTQRGTSNVYDAAWSKPGEVVVVSTLTMTVGAAGELTIARVDEPNPYTTTDCTYQGAISADGTSAGGTVICNSGVGKLGDYPWSASIQCGATVIDWNTNAVAQRGMIGQHTTYTCPPNGTPAGVWGIDYYTDDSSICTAAVHIGLITFETGGTVTIITQPGLKTYEGSERNGVSSQSYGAWDGSYTFAGVDVGPLPPEVLSWGANAVGYRGQNGVRYTFKCPVNGSAYTVWGTDVYTDDSSICTAAVHAGLISLTGGGIITIEIREALDSYTESTRNGITSRPWGPWKGSYVFVRTQE